MSGLRYLGLLGFIGLLGLFTDNPGFYGFFGFFGFLGFTRRNLDERLAVDVGKAATRTFQVAMVAYAAAATVVGITRDFSVLAWAFIITTALQILVFSLSLTYYDWKGGK